MKIITILALLFAGCAPTMLTTSDGKKVSYNACRHKFSNADSVKLVFYCERCGKWIDAKDVKYFIQISKLLK